MQTKTLRADFTVVGGGLAGVFAAIEAARQGATVTLVQDRPVLGGNCSSEVRLWALGAPHARTFNRYSREGGIAEELILESLYRNPEGNPVLWDPILTEWVTREPNITLLLDTAAHEVDLDDDGAIRSVTGFCSPSQTTYVCRSPLFLDASGDGILGFLAGADFRVGREPSSEFGESLAPKLPDRKVLGSSIYFFTKRAERPVRFVPPASAVDIASTTIPQFRTITDTTEGSHYWWIAYGGLLDTIYDHQEIKLHLWSLVYGIWDHIKNSGEFPAERVDNLTLEWVGPIPGKRESRRFIGDYILRESDAMEQTVHNDAVASGGWSLDLHPSEGIYSPEPPCHQIYSDGVYGIPYRCLYSRTVPNLFIGGRLVSASHVAFGSTRVMLTCGVMGQAAGAAAALCIKEGLLPRDLAEGDALQILQQGLLRADQYIPGVTNDDPADLARDARVTASSTAALTGTRTDDVTPVPLDAVRGVQIPLADRLDTVAFSLDVSAPTTLRWSVWRNDRRVNYVPREEVCSGEVAVEAGDAQWVELPVNVDLAGENCWVLLEPNDAVSLRLTGESLAGVLSVCKHDRPDRPEGPHWPVEDGTHAFQITPEQAVWSESNVTDGHARPHIMPHLWVSDPIEDVRSEWLELPWDEPRELSEVRIAVNTDLNRVIYNIQHRYDERIVRHALRDIRVDIPDGDGWRTIASTRDNRQRMVAMAFEAVTTDRLRVVCEATNGHDRCEIYEIRAY